MLDQRSKLLTSTPAPAMSAAAISALGLFAVMQLPGRALMANRRVTLSGEALVAISLVLQAVGLIVVAALPTASAVAAGVACVHQGDPPSLDPWAASNRRADPNEDTP